MRHLDDNHMAQIDATATKHAQAEDWRTTKPTKHVGLHPVFASILSAHGMPQSTEADKVRDFLADRIASMPEPAAPLYREAEPVAPALIEYGVWVTLADGIARELDPIKAASAHEAHGAAIRAGIAKFKQPLTASVTPRLPLASQAYGVIP